MQLLCKDSEESETKALGIFDVSVKRFPDSVLVPQIGWNGIILKKHSPLFYQYADEKLYFVHSYRADNEKENNDYVCCNKF